jgi:chloride channel 2
VASTFGAPIGAVLFSIEVTCTYYPVSNLWRGMFTTVFGSFFFFVWRKLDILGSYQILLFSTNFPYFPYQLKEILMFVAVGVLCGITGAFFIYLYTKVVHLRQRYKLVEKYRYYLVGGVALLTAIVSYPSMQLMRVSIINIYDQHED